MDLGRYVSFWGNADTTRFCYLRLELLQKAISEPRILEGLLKQLAVPGKAGVLRHMSDREKLVAIEHQIETFRSAPASVWRGVNAPEVLAASIFRASVDGALPQKVGRALWHYVKTESSLAAPVARWLGKFQLQTFVEVPLGTKRADVVGYREGGFFSETLCVVVELKNEGEQLRRGLDQMTTFAAYGHETYLACTPYFAATYLDRHSNGVGVKHWDSNALKEKLEAFGFGLLLVEGDSVYEVMKPTRRSPGGAKLDQVRFALKSARRG